MVMSPAGVESTRLESSLMPSPNHQYVSPKSFDEERCFDHLRGVQWRINLGILPSSSSVDDLRRVTADYRRRYAGLRRRLLLDPHLPMDRTSSPNLVMDNPLSQNPDSMWGRFFQNAELEKMVDQDLSRLYPENGSYFQTPGCQGILRRILLLWCLRHPEYGYRQGMHELLAPLLYVLHVDVEHLFEVQSLYQDHFADKFDGLSFRENDLTYNFELKNFPDLMEDDETFSNGNTTDLSSLDNLDADTRTVVLLSDAYGAEGELGIVLSDKFMEHDAFSMFDALMSGSRGAVAMANFFSPSPATGSQTGLSPVIEASYSLYRLLSIADQSLHSHLVELGVEPQYFALRWLRVLFGREFSLPHLLTIWDEIFASQNIKSVEESNDDAFGILRSPRGALISSIAVSMLLYLRSSLLATENPTSCLQRLLNFPDTVNLNDLIAKAKSLQLLALNGDYSSLFDSGCVSFDSPALKTPLILVPESYWEEKWRVLHKADELQKKNGSNRKKGWSEKLKLGLLRTESCPSSAIIDADLKEHRPPVRRSLLDDFSRDPSPCEEIEKSINQGSPQNNDPLLFFEAEMETQECANNSSSSGNGGSDENSSVISDPSSPNDIESACSVVSNLSVDEKCSEETVIDGSPIPPGESLLPLQEVKEDSVVKFSTLSKEKKFSIGKFPWFWKFGRNAAAELVAFEKGGGTDCAGSSVCSKEDSTDQNLMVNLRNLGQSMLENIQVIEASLHRDYGQVDDLEKNAGKGALAALKELRKISNSLSEI